MDFEFDFGFPAVAAADIIVLYNDGTALNTIDPSDYTLFLNPPLPGELWSVGGNVIYSESAPIANGTSITIKRLLPLTQETNIADQGIFYPQVVERALDTLEMQLQQVAARTGKWMGTWESGTTYNVGDLVVDGAAGANSQNIYMCIISNTSSVWATELAAGDWTLAIPTVLGVATLPLSLANGGTGVTSLAALIALLGFGTAAGENLGTVIIDDGVGNLTINDGVVTNAMLADMAANTVKVNDTASPAAPNDLEIPENSVLGRADGNIIPLELGAAFSIDAGVLNVTGAGGGGGGVIVDFASASYSTSGAVSGFIPLDNTIPQRSEGQNLMTASITPKKSTNQIMAAVHISGAPDDLRPLIVTMFKTGSDNAIRTVANQSANNNNNTTGAIAFHHIFTTGSTSQITVQINAASNSIGASLNQSHGYNFGGTMQCTLTLFEIDPSSGGGTNVIEQVLGSGTFVTGTDTLIDFRDFADNDEFDEYVLKITDLSDTGHNASDKLAIRFASAGTLITAASSYTSLASVSGGVYDFDNTSIALQVTNIGTNNILSGTGEIQFRNFSKSVTGLMPSLLASLELFWKQGSTPRSIMLFPEPAAMHPVSDSTWDGIGFININGSSPAIYTIEWTLIGIKY